jgi:hypothetical protein
MQDLHLSDDSPTTQTPANHGDGTDDASDTSDTTDDDRDQRNQSLPAREGANDQQSNLPPDANQGALRTDRPVHRIGLDPVHDQMRIWADNDDLGTLLESAAQKREAAEAARRAHQDAVELAQQNGTPPPPNPTIPPTVFTEAELREALGDEFTRMNDGQRMAVVATVARMSQAYHDNHGVGHSPEPPRDGGSAYQGAPDRRPKPPSTQPTPDPIANIPHGSAAAADRVSAAARASAATAWPAQYREPGSAAHGALTDLRRQQVNNPQHQLTNRDIKPIIKSANNDFPDFSGKNYAVVEMVDSDGNSTYVVDSSIPAGGKGYSPRHSERHLLDWVDRLNASKATAGEGQYTMAGLYTEREPCGQGLGHAKCAGRITERTENFPVYYATTYRTDPAGQPARDALRAQLVAGKAAGTNNMTSGQIDAAVKATRTANEVAMDAEMDNHLRAVGELWAKTRIASLAP